MIDQYDSLAEKFIRKWFWLYFFSFLIWPIWYLTKIIISNELSVSDVWIIYWTISLIALLDTYNDMWMSESLKKFIPKYITEKRYDKVKSLISYAMILQMFTSIIIFCIFYFWSSFLWEHYFQNPDAGKVLKIFAFYFIWLNVFQTLECFFSSVQNTFAQKIAELSRNLFVFIYILFIFVLWYDNLINFSYAWVFWLYMSLFISIWIFYNKYYKMYLSDEKISYNKEIIKEVIKYSSLVVIWSSIGTVLSQIDMQMIIYMLWTKDAWYYTNYLSIVNIPFLLIWPVFSMMFPIISELHSKWENDKILLIKNFFSKNLILIWIMFNIFFFIFAQIIAYTLFWEKYIESWNILRFSALFLIFNFILQINSSIMSWIWILSKSVKIVTIVMFFNILTNIVFINLFWAWWAALATWIWWILFLILQEKELWKEYRLSVDYKPIIKNLWIFLTLWIIIYEFVLWKYDTFSRLESFFIIWFCFLIRLTIFVFINLNDFKWFFSEIKKLKKH